MTLANALSNALSGIAYTSRATEVVASNVANSLDPAYARRELLSSSRAHIANGGGVRIDGVIQIIKEGVVAQNRLALGDAARTATLETHAAQMEKLIGVPGSAGSLSATLSAFNEALIDAAGRPDSETALSRLSQGARQLADHMNQTGRAVQAARTEADRAIKADVDALNTGLTRVAELNRQIAIETTSGNDANALKDQRRTLIDKLSEIVPLKELPREAGKIALVTGGGAILLDGSKPIPIGFETAGQISPDMEGGTPPMSWLSYDGDVLASGHESLFRGGRIEANFQIRDAAAPAMQARLDAFARDIFDRAADPSVDPTTAGLTALFTDGGAAFEAADERGFANRIALNAAVDADQGGDLWRLRAGLHATGPGEAGDGALLNRLSAAFTQTRPTASGAIPAGSRSAAGLAGEIASFAASRRLDAEADSTAAATQQASLASALRADGVNTDSEMERLLALERAYAANAKVFQAVDDMLSSLLRM